MILNRLNRFRIALIIGALVCFSQPAFGDTYLLSQWSDVNKSWNGDSNLCWAATASNMLYYAKWDTASYNTAASIFNNFKYYWTNESGYIDYGLQWWLNGTSPPSGYGGATASGGGNYWPSVDAASVIGYAWYIGSSSSEGNAMADIAAYLPSKAVGLAIYRWNGQGGHAITVWGYDYHLVNGNLVYDAIWVTDSDDGYIGLKRYSVHLDSHDPWIWDLGDGYSGWYIGWETWLEINQNPVPIPSGLLLFGFGLLGLAGLKRFVQS
jgi:hypothetical protein